MESKVPRTVDRQMLFLMWEIGDIAWSVIGMVITFATGSYIPLVIGIIASNIYIKAKERYMENFVIHWLYKKGILSSKTKKLVPGYIRRFYE